MSFVALREIASSFGETRSPRRERYLRHLAADLGAVVLPLCFRSLPKEPAWAVQLLEAVADSHPDLRSRVLEGLRHAAASSPQSGRDDVKVAALTLLAGLGEQLASASFADPLAVHRRSLGELSSLLTCAPDVALAAELLITQLDGGAICELIDELAQTAPARTRHLVDELLLRSDLDASLRSELARIAAPIALVEPEPLAEAPHRRPRVLTLTHGAGRSVVIVLRHDRAAWRCLCALVDSEGCLGDALYRDDTTPHAIEDELVEPLTADGFTIASARPSSKPTRAGVAPATRRSGFALAATPRELEDARALLAAAARRTVTAGRELPSAYFLGRDLLDLGDAHEPDWRRREADVATTLLGRGVDLLAAGELERARPLLERATALVPDDAEAAASFGLCLLGHGDLDGARLQLERAIALEPRWALHHWNLAAIAHRQGRLGDCQASLRRYLALARHLEADAEHAPRIALARAFVRDHERLRRLSARPRRSAPRRSPARP